jgi:hypothetical protein
MLRTLYCGDRCCVVVNDSMKSKSSLSITASARSIVTRNLSRRTASDSGDEVLVIVLVLSTTLLLDKTACSMLLLKVVRLVKVLPEVFWVVSDGDFMVLCFRGVLV